MFANLKPDDWLTVYHGTTLSQSFSFLNGFDATKVVGRHYGGPRHRGLFIAPNFRAARHFASYGPVVIEMVVRAKNLHGTDYSGVTGREDPRREDIWRDRFPNSFRPYLSQTLSQSPEPQALLLGLVSPRQIKKVWHEPYGEQGEWHTRREFLSLGLEFTPDKDLPYGRKKLLQDLEIDLSYPNYSYEELIQALSKLLGDPGSPMPQERVLKALQWRLKHLGDEVQELIEDVGFEPRAARQYAKLLKERFEAGRMASRVLRRYATQGTNRLQWAVFERYYGT